MLCTSQSLTAAAASQTFLQTIPAKFSLAALGRAAVSLSAVIPGAGGQGLSASAHRVVVVVVVVLLRTEGGVAAAAAGESGDPGACT